MDGLYKKHNELLPYQPELSTSVLSKIVAELVNFCLESRGKITVEGDKNLSFVLHQKKTSAWKDISERFGIE